MESLSGRKAQITNMNHVANTVSVEALVPMRGLIGFETDLVNMTKGMGVMSHLFHEYGTDRGVIPARKNGSLVAMEAGEATSYALNIYPGARTPDDRGEGPGLRRHDASARTPARTTSWSTR